VPRRFYTTILPGIPDHPRFRGACLWHPARFRALDDSEALFRPEDYLTARDGEEMTAQLRRLRADRELRADVVRSGLETIRARHTCAHRVDELLKIVASLRSALPSGERGPVSATSSSENPSPFRRLRRRPPSANGSGIRNCCMKIAFYGSSLLSSYWNGAATYYRGLLRDLAGRGYDITFYEPDAFDRQSHKDMEAPAWAKSVVYDATPEALRGVLARAAEADIVVKASGVGVFDTELLEGIIAHSRPGATRIFWDVDAAANAGRDARRLASPGAPRAARSRHGAHLWRRPSGDRGLSGLRRPPLRARLQCA
jgi:hypothetical protein